mgnify:CR=1 FL=1
MANQKVSVKRLPECLGSALAKGRAEKRLSLKGQHIAEDIGTLKLLTHIENTSDLIRGVILKINDDIVQNKRQNALNELRGIAAAFG